MKHLPIRACLRYVALCLIGTAGLAGMWTGIAHGADGPRSLTLKLEPQEGVEITPSGTACFAAGAIDRLRMTQCEHIFLLKNNEKLPVTIDRLQPSCACTTAFVDPVFAGMTLEPGKAVAVRVTVDTAHLRPGMIHKSVYVFLRGESLPAVTMEMAANILPEVTFHPAVLSFGRIPFHGQRSLPMTATVNALLLQPSIAAKLVSSDPNISVTPVGSPTKPDSKSGVVTQSYNVTLNGNGSIGLRQGDLLFKPNASLSSDTNKSLAGASSAWDSLTVTADVVGNLTASPSAVVFGRIPKGDEVHHTVTLQGGDPNILKGLTVSSPSTWLSVRLVSSTANTGRLLPENEMKQKRMLEVSLKKFAPSGQINTHITITASDGEKLTLPILAYVDPR